MNRFKVSLDNQLEKDKDELHKLGYIQELNRSIGVFSNFAISFSVISILSGLITLYGYGLYYSGLASFWSWLIVGPFQIILVIALAEIASKFPLAGGAYKWAAILGNDHIGWFCGWISIIGWLACTAGIVFGLADFLISFLGYDRENYKMLLTVLTLIVFIHAIINMFGIKRVTKFNNFSVVVHITGVILISILLMVFGRNNSIEYLFSPSAMRPGFLWGGLLSTFLMAAWTITGFDASANISEESLNPSKTVPYGMILSVVVSFAFGTLLLLSLGQAVPDVNEVLSSKMAAVPYIISKVLGPVVSKFVIVIVMIAMFAAGLAAQTLLVRVIFAFSRDNGLPFSNIWKYVSNRYGTPVYSIIVACAAVILLSVIAILLTRFSDLFMVPNIQTIKVLPVITSLSTLGVYLSHAITLATAIFNKKDIWKEKGSFRLGRFSLLLEIVAFLWACFIVVTVFVLNLQAGLIFSIILVLLIIVYLASIHGASRQKYKVLSVSELKRIEKMRNN